MTHPGSIALRAKARGWARSERCQDPRPGALSNRLLLALDEYPRFEELTKVLEMHSSEPLCNPTGGVYANVYDYIVQRGIVGGFLPPC